MNLSKHLGASIQSAISLESHKLDSDVVIGAPQTLITLKDALNSAEEDRDASTFVEEEIAEFETVNESLESLDKINKIYIRDGGLTPALASVYNQTFDRLMNDVGMDRPGISKVSQEAFELDPMTASMEAMKETETAKTSVMEKVFTKSKLFAVKLGDFLSSYKRVAARIKDTVEEVSARKQDSAQLPTEIVGAWKSVSAISKRMNDFTNRTRMEVSAMQESAKSEQYTKGDYVSVFEALGKQFAGEQIPGGKFVTEKGATRFVKQSFDTESTVSLDSAEIKKILKDVSDAAEFIGSYSALLEDVEKEIVSSLKSAEKRLGTQIGQSFTDYMLDINSIMKSVRGPGPDYLSYLGSLCRDTLSHLSSSK